MNPRYSIPILAHQLNWPFPVDDNNLIHPASFWLSGLWTHLSIRINLFLKSGSGDNPISTEALALLMPDLPFTIIPNRFSPFLEIEPYPADKVPDHWDSTWGRPMFRATAGYFTKKSIRASIFDVGNGQSIAFYLHDCMILVDDSLHLPIILGGDFFHDPCKANLELHLKPELLSPNRPFTFAAPKPDASEYRHHHRHLSSSPPIGTFIFSALD